MKTRILSAAAALVILFGVLLCGKLLILKIAAALIAVIGLFELYRAFHYRKHQLLCLAGYIVGAAIPFFSDPVKIIGLLFVYLVLGMGVMLSRKGELSFSALTDFFFFQIYLPCSLTCLVWVRESDWGLYALWLVLGGAWLTDTFAYFTGRAFGKRKLCPEISPHKTVAGAVGGIVGTTLSALLYGLYLNTRFTVSFPAMLALGILLGLLAQIGDLTASWIKREHSVKDFGNLMPGHGGVMDRFDSILLTAPTVCLFLTCFTLLAK